MDLALFTSEGLLFFLRWLHILGGVSWIGILWYFNFSQGPFMNEVDPTVKSAVNGKLAPRTMWYFRWGAMLTFLSGFALVSIMASQGGGAYMTSSRGVTVMTGGLMGILMWFNVWFVIWPRTKKIIAAANGGPAVENAAAVARRAFLASRTNTLLSIPLLFMMATAGHLTLAVNPDNVRTWFAVLLVLLALLEANALLAGTGATTKPIEKPKGVIHMGVLLTVIVYALMEVLL